MAAGKSQELAGLKREVARYDTLESEVKTLSELLTTSSGDDVLTREAESRVAAMGKNIAALETEILFAGKYDKGNSVLSVYAGAGGKDAEDWSALRYSRCQRSNRTLHFSHQLKSYTLRFTLVAQWTWPILRW